MNLLEFVRALPAGFAYAPIYAVGQVLPDGHVSKGKTPLGRAHHQIMGAADVALQIERHPNVFRAVGVFSGPRSNGLVILDVDANLRVLRRKWGSSLDGAPCVTSTKANAAKFLFRVPEEHWNQVKGISLAATGAGYEVLWGRQGLLYGAYPGSSDGKAPEGFYGFTGDLEAIPEAPDWLIAEMRDAASQSEPVGKGFLKNRKALDFSDRTEDEIAEIVQDCLRVIPHLGAGSRDQWVQIGMAIHDALPNEMGLTLWSAWSSEDPEYADDWSNGNPCEGTWASFKRGGGIRFNSLIWMADQQDPMRRRFSDVCRETVERAETATVQRVQSVGLTHKQIVERATKAMAMDNPSEVQHALHEIAMEARYRDSAAVVRLLIADQEFKRGSKGGSLSELLAEEDETIEYLIPGLLPQPGTVLVHGRGGCGKTMAVMTLAKHVARGIPFSVAGDDVPVERGTVLWLNGDQNSRRIKKQFRDLGFTQNDPVVVENKVSMLWYPWFIQMVEKHRPKLVVWDSVTACMRGCAYDQNKAEYAEPLYWYSAENGESFPATTIVFIHHANKEGNFRGTTALEDAADESWGIRKPNERDAARLGTGTRLITIGKSREGNEDKQLLLTQRDDLTFELRDFADPSAAHTEGPATVVDRVLQRLRTAGKPMRLTDLNADPLVGGSVEAVKKSLRRLVDRGLVRTVGPRTTRSYEAVVVRKGGFSTGSSGSSRTGGPVKVVPNEENPVVERDLEGTAVPKVSLRVPENGGVSLPFSTDGSAGTAAAVTEGTTKGHEGTRRDSSGTAVSSHTNGSGAKGQGTGGRPIEQRSKEEMDRLFRAAEVEWDDLDEDESPLRTMSRQEVDSSNIEAIQSHLDGAPPAVVDVKAKTV